MDKIVDGNYLTTEMKTICPLMHLGEDIVKTAKDDSKRRVVFVFKISPKVTEIREAIKLGKPIPIDDSSKYLDTIRRFHSIVNTTLAESDE